MSDKKTERALIVFFRLTMAWTFLYAASHQVFVSSWSVVGFLHSIKTFHSIYIGFASPYIAAVVTFLVEYGHLLIGLSLLIGLMVRVSASVGFVLMVIYWTAHMNFPYVGTGTTNFLVDEHAVYAGVLFVLVIKHAGYVWGLDALVVRSSWVQRHPRLNSLFA